MVVVTTLKKNNNIYNVLLLLTCLHTLAGTQTGPCFGRVHSTQYTGAAGSGAEPPSGVSVTSSSFAKAGSGIYTCTQTIESGDNVRSVEVHLTGNEVGTHEIVSEVYYQFDGSMKSPTRYETLTLIVEPDTRPTDSKSEAREIVVSGFGSMVAVMGLLAVYLWRRQR